MDDVKPHHLEDKVYQLTGQFAELFLLLMNQFENREPAAMAYEDFSGRFCRQRGHCVTKCPMNPTGTLGILSVEKGVVQSHRAGQRDRYMEMFVWEFP